MDYLRKRVAIRHLPGVEARVLRQNSAGSLAVEIVLASAAFKAYKVGDTLTIMPYEVKIVPEMERAG